MCSSLSIYKLRFDVGRQIAFCITLVDSDDLADGLFEVVAGFPANVEVSARERLFGIRLYCYLNSGVFINRVHSETLRKWARIAKSSGDPAV